MQRTGWGKSLVYFLATKILRKRKKGISIIISPLLALMDNQIESALKFQLNIVTVNSTNKEEWTGVYEALNADNADALIISPERLKVLNKGIIKQLKIQGPTYNKTPPLETMGGVFAYIGNCGGHDMGKADFFTVRYSASSVLNSYRLVHSFFNVLKYLSIGALS